MRDFAKNFKPPFRETRLLGHAPRKDEPPGEAQPLAFGQGAMEVSVATSGRVVYLGVFQG